MTDTEIVQLIYSKKEGKALLKLYKYQGKVQGLIKSRGGSKEDGEDIFQEALVVLCNNVWKGNFKLTSSLGTYLYSVSYNIWRNKSEKKQINFDKIDGIMTSSELNLDEHYEREEKFAKVESILKEIGDPCLTLLKAFYHRGMKMVEIVKELGYKSVNSAKVQKFKCLERAKKLI
jgi:RNA polymerase sigma factor (sigma-70 family)